MIFPKYLPLSRSKNNPMRKISASLLFDGIHEPVKNKVLFIQDNGTIDGIFDLSTLEIDKDEIEMLDGILCPGFVNAHCNLELSWLHHLIPEKTGLDNFIRNVASITRPREEVIQSCIDNAETQMMVNGIVAVADIMNTGQTFHQKLAKRL